MAMVLTQVRDVFFTKVGQPPRETTTARSSTCIGSRCASPGAARVGCRASSSAARGVELILRMGILQVVPTVLGSVFITALLLYYFNWIYVAVIYATVAVYMWFTFAASEWRIAIRREMNDSDNDANTKAIDSLLNFETVKYFGNEGLEARASTPRWHATSTQPCAPTTRSAC